MARELVQYATLDDALTRFGIPDGNHAFIRTFVEAIGIRAYYETSGYIKAERADGGPQLNIASGWSNGFVSEQEIVDILGDVDRWGDDERPRLWGVSHPINNIGHGGGGPAGTGRRSYGTCPECFMELPANGVCNCG